MGTLLVDLLTEPEERIDERTAEIRFDIALLTRRLVGILDWLKDTDATRALAIGLFGASTGAAAALRSAAARPKLVRAVVSRGGRVDLAANESPDVAAATLLIVGGADTDVLALNRWSLPRIGAGEKRLAVVAGATHLFAESGALEQVASLAAAWFLEHLGKGTSDGC